MVYLAFLPLAGKHGYVEPMRLRLLKELKEKMESVSNLGTFDFDLNGRVRITLFLVDRFESQANVLDLWLGLGRLW